MNKVECKLCYSKFEAVDVESICPKCFNKVCKFLNIDPDSTKDTILSNFIYLVSKSAAMIDYLDHAIDNHTHSTKTVNVVNVQ